MAKKKKKKSTGGIVSYLRKINNSPGVKSKTKRVNKLKAALKKAQRAKNAAVKKAQRKFKKKQRA
jgi:hypothetical protein